ncbi:MAG: YihY/virulence factor BrkB family protein [Pseudomonadota bacterium]
MVRASYEIVRSAVVRFNTSDDWALASHVALSGLFGLFPFIIFMTVLATSIGRWLYQGDVSLADQAVVFLFDGWPSEASEPIAREIRNVLDVPRKGLLTLSALLTLLLASNVVEALRVPLNRAYAFEEKRTFLYLRAQSVLFVITGALGIFLTLLLLVLAPVALKISARFVPILAQTVNGFEIIRLGAAGAVLLLCLLAFHRWLPAGRRRWRTILPGVLVTLLGFIAASALFGWYLENFAVYADTYAGLAGVMIGLFYMYILAVIFIFGAEINAAAIARRDARKSVADGPRGEPSLASSASE